MSKAGFHPPRNVGLLVAPRLTLEGFCAKPAQALLVCLPKPLAGMGTARQLQGIAAGIRGLQGASDFELGYVGPPVEGSDPLLADPIAPVLPTVSVADSYRAVSCAFRRAFDRLLGAGVRRVAVLCMGYTAFGPEGIKRAVAECEKGKHGLAPEEVLVLIVDSAYPDTDGREVALDGDGWPRSRFFSPAYESDDRVKTFFLLTSAYDYDFSLLNERAPLGLTGVSVIAPPYTDEYLSMLVDDGRLGRENGLGDVAARLPGMSAFASGDILAPLVSSDIWSDDAVGVWMTRQEHESCLTGTRSIVSALATTAKKQGRRIWMPIDVAAARHIAAQALEGVEIASSRQIPSDASLVLSPYRGLSQRDHSRLLGASDIAISRTGGQANATTVLALTRTPNIVIDMPAFGYMQSELTSLCMTHRATVSEEGEVETEPLAEPLAWRGEWSWSKEALSSMFDEVLSDQAERGRRATRAYFAFNELRSSKRGNVFSILRSIALG